MTFLKAMVVVAFFVLGGYYLYNMDEVNNQVGPTLTKSTDFFIDKSDQIITVVDLWANGPKQTYATSGSENINFAAVDDAIVEDEQTIPQLIVQLTQEEKELKSCEDNFKACVDSAHASYGVYISVKEVKTFNDISAVEFYTSRKSNYQPEFNQEMANYPLIFVHAEAEGLGQFVAICKNGEYPKGLNSGLPC